MYWKGRWTFRNCSSSHRVLMPESALSRLWILPRVTTHSRNSSENLSIWSGVTHVIPEARGCWVVSMAMGADSKWVTHCRVWATSGGSCTEEATRSTSRRWDTGAAGGESYGRKYWGRYRPTPGTYITNISAQEATSTCQQFHHSDSHVLIFFHKIFLKVDLQR